MLSSKVATTIIISSLVVFPVAVTAQSNTVFNTIQETGVLKVAIREDAAPFGYLDRSNKLAGFCLDFFVLSPGFDSKLISLLLYRSTICQLEKNYYYY